MTKAQLDKAREKLEDEHTTSGHSCNKFKQGFSAAVKLIRKTEVDPLRKLLKVIAVPLPNEYPQNYTIQKLLEVIEKQAILASKRLKETQE